MAVRVEVEYGDEVVDGDTATVAMTIFAPDIAAIGDAVFADAAGSLAAAGHGGRVEPDPELPLVFMSALADPYSPKTESKYEARLVRVDGEWRVRAITRVR
ncbi:hypothetical protein J2Z79_001409 [Symbiobacterium terraclitae]|uniref:Uncharacterized protein n=1 Tax=Symbiobacterium terraclitae TaxID=557451 RepID=A0ABS4JR71_9FIRM|nr:hypothetical protein [Symbiobacterium terraclitae]MBP2018010.1 hypothetical protein [Symbiobacterium terraclitae]